MIKKMNIDNDIIFKSKVSKWIAGLYVGILIFLVIMFIGMPFVAPMTFLEKIIFITIYFIVFLVIIFTLYRAYRLIFIISKDRFVIGGLLKKHIIMFSDIKEVKKTPIPLGFRLFGASLLGGRYYFPGVGNASVAMSNFDDGVLVTTKDGYNFLITPMEPLRFIDILKDEIK